jgi:hypothetical protein
VDVVVAVAHRRLCHLRDQCLGIPQHPVLQILVAVELGHKRLPVQLKGLTGALNDCPARRRFAAHEKRQPTTRSLPTTKISADAPLSLRADTARGQAQAQPACAVPDGQVPHRTNIVPLVQISKHEPGHTGLLEVHMDALKILALILIIGGGLGLVYGGFSYTKATHTTDIGPVHLEMKERQRINIPLWAGLGALIGGGLLLVAPRKT